MDHGIIKDPFGFRLAPWSTSPVRGLDCRAMDRRLARRNIRTGLITGVIGLLMFALTFVAALAYIG